MPSAPESNVIALYRAWLLSSSTITDQVGASGVYGPPGIPGGQVDTMPKKIIILLPDGGPETPIGIPTATSLIQVRCYGATAYEASTVSGAVYQFAHRQGATQITLSGSIYNLYLSRRAGSPYYGTEPEVGWPYYMSQYRVRLSEAAVG